MARETKRGRPPGEVPGTTLPVGGVGGGLGRAGGRGLRGARGRDGGGLRRPGGRGGLRRRGPRWAAPRGPRGRAGGGDHDLTHHAPLGVGGEVTDELVGAGGAEGEAGLPAGPRGDVRGAQVERFDDEVVLPAAGVAEDEVDRPHGGGELIGGEEVLVAPLAHLHRDGLSLGPGGGWRQEDAAEGEGATGQDAEPGSGGQETAWCQLVPLRCGLWDRTYRSSRDGACGTERAAADGLARQGGASGWGAGTIYVIRVSPGGGMCRAVRGGKDPGYPVGARGWGPPPGWTASTVSSVSTRGVCPPSQDQRTGGPQAKTARPTT